MSMPTCKSCGAPIYWTTTAANGRAMPVDREPAENGNVRVDAGISRTLNVAEVTAARLAGVPLHLSHFVTCPNAKRHKRGARS